IDKTRRRPARRVASTAPHWRMASITHSPRTALVIGCGIGGPFAALALQKAGIEPAIFEAHDGDAEFVGSFLNLASNGLDALDTIGVRGAVANRGFAAPQMVRS